MAKSPIRGKGEAEKTPRSQERRDVSSAAPHPDGGERAADSARPESEAQHVLVIDDDHDMCRNLEEILTEGGYRVSVCSESTRAMTLLNTTPYGCALLDIRMPGLEGTDLLPIIKHRHPHLPVIIVSAYVAGLDPGYYRSLGAFDLVAKPFNNERLLDVVNRAVGATETIPLMLTSMSLAQARDQVYRKLIVTALRRANWSQTKAAELLGISRYSLIRWLRRLQIRY